MSSPDRAPESEAPEVPESEAPESEAPEAREAPEGEPVAKRQKPTEDFEDEPWPETEETKAPALATPTRAHIHGLAPTPAASGGSLSALPPGWMDGTIKWYDETKGFGFVTKTDGTDVFLHHSALQLVDGMEGVETATPVWFSTADDKQGRPKAAKITAVGGGNLPGTKQKAGGLVAASAPSGGGGGGGIQPVAVGGMVPPTQHGTDPLPEGRARGVCKWFDQQKGFGFITTQAGEDIFFHQTELKVRDGYDRHRSLAEGECVECSFTEDPNKNGRKKATGITGPGGAPVVGSPPPVATPAPHYGAPQYGAPAPHYGAPAPHYGAPAPHYGAPAPHYADPAAAYQQPQYTGTPEEQQKQYEEQLAAYNTYQQQLADYHKQQAAYDAYMAQQAQGGSQ